MSSTSLNHDATKWFSQLYVIYTIKADVCMWCFDVSKSNSLVRPLGVEAFGYSVVGPPRNICRSQINFASLVF